MGKLIWSMRAVKDLDAICDHIALDSAQYAYTFAERIVTKIESIPSQPLLGQVVPEYNLPDLRERLFQNYRIVYRVRLNAVEVVTIVHGARLLPTDPPT